MSTHYCHKDSAGRVLYDSECTEDEKDGRGEVLEFELLTADICSLSAIAYFVRTERPLHCPKNLSQETV